MFSLSKYIYKYVCVSVYTNIYTTEEGNFQCGFVILSL